MPCCDCGTLLCVPENVDENESTELYCPECKGLDIESQGVVDVKADWMIEERFPENRIIDPLREYEKPEVIQFLVTRLNWRANKFMNRNGFPLNEFGYLAYLIHNVYQADNFGSKSLPSSGELHDIIDTLRDAYSKLIRTFLDAKYQFVLCERDHPMSDNFDMFVNDYIFHQTEYGLCFERCVSSLLCGDYEHYREFSYVQDNIRSADRTDPDDVETLEEFADAWYPLIMELRLIASADQMVGDVFETRLESVTVFDIEEFLENLDQQLSPEEKHLASEKGQAIPLSEECVDKCGKRVFGDQWASIRDQLIVSDQHREAHPFLFQIERYEEYPISGSDETATVPKTSILYPRAFARLLKFQIFPLLNNGNKQSGHSLLKNVNDQQSKQYELNLYNHIKDQSSECYLRPEIDSNDGSEIDLLFLSDDNLFLIEEKFFMPPIKLNKPDGMRVLREKFDLAIFHEEPEDRHRSPSGKSFPEKVQMWRDVELEDTFSADASSTSSNRTPNVVTTDWKQKTLRKFVISNVVPPYIEKQGVQFLSDLEFYKYIESNMDDIQFQTP